MSQDGIGVSGLDEFERCPPIIPGNWLMPEPDDRLISITCQLFGRSEDPHNGFQALLDELRVGSLGQGVAVYVGELCEISERQPKPPAHSQRRHEVPFPNVCKQSRQHGFLTVRQLCRYSTIHAFSYPPSPPLAGEGRGEVGKSPIIVFSPPP
jgi:hypothetical protein